MTDRVRRVLLALVGPIILIAVWYLASSPRFLGIQLLPLPGATFRRVVELLLSADFAADIGATFERWAIGFAMAIAIGTPVGLVLGISPVLDGAVNVIVDFFRSLPVTAAFPVFLIVFGIGEPTMIAMVFFATVFIVILNASYGVKATSPTRQMMARSFGATQFQVFVHIRAVEAVRQVLIGMRTVLSLSLVVAIVSEMFIGATHGIGQRLYLSYQLQSLTDLYAIVLIAGLLGYFANRVFLVIEHRVSA